MATDTSSLRTFLTQLVRRIRHGIALLLDIVRGLPRRVTDRLMIEDHDLCLPLTAPPVRIPPIPAQPYGHGAFMGAAPAMMADPRWARILAFLMPDVHADVLAARRTGARGMIPMLENNPVMCAYGIHEGARRRRARGDRHHDDLAAIEWDVFVASSEVNAWKAAAEHERGAYTARIVDTMIIAHASTIDLVQEVAGLCQYEDVRDTPRARLGGVRVPAWLDLFARALELADAEDLPAALRSMATEPRNQAGPASERHTFADPWPAERAIAGWRHHTGREHLSFLLEMKSLRSDPALLADIVRDLNRRGLHVHAVASFDPDEIAGVSSVAQELGGETLAPPHEIRFFHWCGDLQFAAAMGHVAPGSRALFNGATLLEHNGSDGYRVRGDVVDELAELCAGHDVRVGVYVQEYDCDANAVALLSDLVAQRPDAIALGFAWGGLVDEACVAPDAQDRRGLGTQAMLGAVGKARSWRTRVPR